MGVIVHLVALVLAVALGIYLTAALLRPEWFQ